jgi:hypothetical protein
VAACVVQDVDESVPDLARTLEDPSVIAVGEDLPSALGEPVHRAGEAGREALNAAREAMRVRGLHEQVEVVREDRVVDDAATPASFRGLVRCGECSADRRVRPALAEIRRTVAKT